MEACLRLRLAGGNPGGIGDIVGVVEGTLDQIQLKAKSLDKEVFGRGGSATGGNVGGNLVCLSSCRADDSSMELFRC